MTIPWQMHLFASSSIAALMVGGAVDSYAVGGNSPPVVADFVNEYYRVGGSASDFPTMFSGTTTRSDLATMVDSDEVLKWCPHNYASYSEAFNSWTTNGTVTVTANNDTAPDGNTTAEQIDATNNFSGVYLANVYSGAVGDTITFGLCVKNTSGTSQWKIRVQGSNTFELIFDTSTQAEVSKTAGTTATIVNVSGDWYLYELTCTLTASGTNNFIFYKHNAGQGVVQVWGARWYKSSLGGMADVPSDMQSYTGTGAADYVSTGTSLGAKYLQRRGHHIYNGSTWDNKGILIETAARTNLQPYSTVDDGTQWTETNTTNTVNNATSPDGTTNATTITAAAGSSEKYSSDTFTAPASADATVLSAYIKNGTAGYARIQITGGGLVADYVFNLSSGAVAQTFTAGDRSPDVIDVGNGWWRICIYDTNSGAGGNVAFRIGPHDGGAAASWSAAGTETIHVYGVQSELGATPSSYIPTSGATVSRAADSLVIPAANMSHSTSAMSFQMDLVHDIASNGILTFANWYASASEYFSWQDYDNIGSLYTYSVASATSDNVTTTLTTDGINVPVNFATRVTTSTLQTAIGGTASTANTTLTAIPAVSGAGFSLAYDSASASRRIFSGSIGQFRQWNVDLGTSGIETAST